MSAISNVSNISNSGSNLQAHPQVSTSNDEIDPSAFSTPPPLEVEEGVKVSLSEVGLTKSTNTKKTDSDIEESGLPDKIQEILKRIRRLQEKIDETLAQMQAVMADKRLTPEETRMRIGSLQTTLGELSSALLTATSTLSKRLEKSGMSAEEKHKVAALVMSSK